MFAPYCRSCEARVLLGPRRIVCFDGGGSGRRPVVVLRCFCGTLLDWDVRPPAVAPAVVLRGTASAGA